MDKNLADRIEAKILERRERRSVPREKREEQ